jgi:hypothetical protein
MSSTNEGNDEGAREDELDLGQEDEDLPAHVNGQSEDADEDIVQSNETEEPTDDLPSVNVDKHEGTPHLPPQAPGSADELSSIPDDTPSLHVSNNRLDRVSTSNQLRALCNRLQVAAP